MRLRGSGISTRIARALFLSSLPGSFCNRSNDYITTTKASKTTTIALDTTTTTAATKTPHVHDSRHSRHERRHPKPPQQHRGCPKQSYHHSVISGSRLSAPRSTLWKYPYQALFVQPLQCPPRGEAVVRGKVQVTWIRGTEPSCRRLMLGRA